MRANSAAVGGIAHHHIVDPPVRNEAERLEQGGDLWHILVDGLNEQGPALAAELSETRLGERAVLELPAVARLHDQARFDLFLAGQPG